MTPTAQRSTGRQVPPTSPLRRSSAPSTRRLRSALNTSAERLLADLSETGEVIALTSGAWSATKIVALALREIGKPAAVDVWSWTVSRRAIRQLSTWKRDGVAVRVVVDASLRRRQPEYASELVAGLGDAVRFASSHVKAAAVRGPSGSVFIAGSGNLNLCRRAELLFLSRDRSLADWLAANTSTLFDAIEPGLPSRADDAERGAAMERAFPRTDATWPAWATGVRPLVGGPR